MIAFAAPNVIVTREPVENPHEKRIPTAPRRTRSASRQPFPSARKIGRKAKPEAGVNSAPIVVDGPNPCKGWPSATASGGCGLDKGWVHRQFAPPRLRRPGAGLARTPYPIPKSESHALFHLTKKSPYKGKGLIFNDAPDYQPWGHD